MNASLVRTMTRLRLDGPARRVKRLFDSAQTKRDRADQSNMLAILEATLAPDSCCVDIGANVGEVLAEIVRLAPHGSHVAFEPLPHLAADLQRRFPSVAVAATALSDEVGEASFVHVKTRPGWSGFRERPYPGEEELEHLTVPVTRLDDHLPPEYVPTLIKIDVEGAELGTLRGAEQTLRRHRPMLLLEHGLGSADFYGTRPEDVFGFLAGIGYALYGLDGTGPMTQDVFVACFRTGSVVNFRASASDVRRA